MIPMPGVITPQAKALIGVECDPVTFRVEASWLKHFAHAIAWPNPPNPLFYDEEYGKRSRFGSIIAPPTYATRVRCWEPFLPRLFAVLPQGGVGVNGGTTYELLRPIYPGDVLTDTGHLADLTESPRADGGVLLVIRFAGRMENQSGQRVLDWRWHLLRLYGPGDVPNDPTKA